MYEKNLNTTKKKYWIRRRVLNGDPVTIDDPNYLNAP